MRSAKRALPEVVPGALPRSWELGERGREDCVLLAHALAGRVGPVAFCSSEPKARQTADVIALWGRAADADVWGELVSAYVFVESGAVRILAVASDRRSPLLPDVRR